MENFGPADIERVRDAIDELIGEHHLPGIAVGVVQGEELVYAEGFGYADIESGRPQDPALRQCIGSITKTMTGLCTMALVEDRRLSLQDGVVDLLPDVTFHGHTETLTVRHLLSHTGGIGEMPVLEDLRRMEETTTSGERDPTRAPECFPAGITVEVPPGTKFAYANHGFALLGEILMRVEDVDTVDEVLQRCIFRPLGMDTSDCRDQPHPDLTTGYHRVADEDTKELLARIGRVPPDEPTVDGHNIRGRYAYFKGEPRLAQGGVQSTVHDMARYASALLRNGAGIVRPETFDAMLEPQWRPDKRLTGMGLTFFLDERFGRRDYHHGGSTGAGWNTTMHVLPDDDLAVLVHLNLTFAKSDEIYDRILQAVLDAPTASFPELLIDPQVLAPAPGVYEAPLPGPLTNFRIITGTGRIQITPQEGELVLHARRGPWKHGVRMRPVDPDDPAFFVLDTGEPEPPRVALIVGGDGGVIGLRFAALAAVEMVRNDTITPWA